MGSVATMSRYHVKDVALAAEGSARIDWAQRRMPVLRAVRERFAAERPLAGVRIAACLPVTAETGVLAQTLQSGGADVLLCGAVPGSTCDAVAAALVVECGIPVFAVDGEDEETRHAHLEAACDHRPHLVLDDGAEVIAQLHSARREQLGGVIAGCEQSLTGVLRLRALERDGKLAFPIVAVGETATKRLFADRHGVGQATVDAIARAAGTLVAGATWVVAGYGPCGRGIAGRAQALGARVIVTEVDPLRAVEAALEGHRVLPLNEAVTEADVIVTATGSRHVLAAHHLDLLRDGVVLANAGHSNVEIELPALRARAGDGGLQRVRPGVDEIALGGGRSAFLLADGRPVNVAAGSQPTLVLDMALACHALAAEYAVRNAAVLERRVFAVPAEIDREIARVELGALGIAIDEQTAAQRRYLASWGLEA